MPETAAVLLVTWSRSFPAAPQQVGEARRFVIGLLDDRQRTDDVLLCLSELVTNAITHSRSRQPGGCFSVRVQLGVQRLRVEVCDQGGPWRAPGRAGVNDQSGRGLLIVGQLAARWGCEGHSQTGWTVWYEMDTGP